MTEDLQGVTTLMLIFGLALLTYGVVLIATGNKAWLPMRAQHSVRTKDDVRLVGRYTAIIGAVIATVSTVTFLIFA